MLITFRQLSGNSSVNAASLPKANSEIQLVLWAAT